MTFQLSTRICDLQEHLGRALPPSKLDWEGPEVAWSGHILHGDRINWLGHQCMLQVLH